MARMKLPEYRKLQEKRIQKLKKSTKRTPIQAAKYMASMARKLAPRKTGRLIQGIVRRKSTVRIGASNPVNGFPYAKWVNQSEGYKVLNVNKYRDRFGRAYVSINGTWVHVPGKVMIYGSAPAGWDWTGHARFATIARNSARTFYRNTMIKETRKAITVGV